MKYANKIKKTTPASKLVLADALSKCPAFGEHNKKKAERRRRVVLELLDSLRISFKKFDKIETSKLEDVAGMYILKYT